MSSEIEIDDLVTVESQPLGTEKETVNVYPIFNREGRKRGSSKQAVAIGKKGKVISEPRIFSTEFKDNFTISKVMQLHKVFQYHGHKVVNGNVTKNVLVKCNICEEFKSYTESSTTNLLRHLQLQHAEKYHEIKGHEENKQEQPSFRAFTGSSLSKLAKDDPRQKRFDDCVLSLWSFNRTTMDVVNTPEFCDLIAACDPTMNVKSRQAMTKKLEKVVNEKIIPELKRELKTVPSGTISLDLWTSHRKDGIMGVKYHYIDSEFGVQQRTISIREVNEKHTADCLRKHIESAIVEMGLSNKVSFVVTDGGANLVKALKDMQAELELASSEDSDFEILEEEEDDGNGLLETDVSDSEDDLQNDNGDEESESDVPEDFVQGLEISAELLNNLAQLVEPTKLRIPCMAHTLQLVVNSALKKEKRNDTSASTQRSVRVQRKFEPGKASVFIAFVNKIVKFFQNSPRWLSLLRHEVGKGLIKPSVTRWNFIKDVLKRLNEKNVFLAVQKLLFTASSEATNISERRRHPGHLTNEHRSQVQELLTLLDPLCNLTDLLQGDGTTSSIVIPQVAAAFDELKCMRGLKHFQSLHAHLMRECKARFDPILSNSAFVLATVLDPRQKMNVFRIQGDREDTENDVKILPSSAVMTMCNLFLENAETTPKESNILKEPVLPGKLSLFEKMQMQVQEVQKETLEDGGLSELKDYLDEAIDPKVNPLDYWRQRQDKFPHLSRHAKVYLGIPATSGSVERLFTELSGMGRARRSSTKTGRLQQLILYREWKKKLVKMAQLRKVSK